MNKVLSKDGTPIAFDRTGTGPVIILVDGALCYRASGPSGPLADYLAQLNDLISADRRGDAVKLFMKLVGVPAIFVAVMRFMPAWSKLTAVAHTLPYDITIVQDNQRGKSLPAERWASLTVPTLVVVGGKSPAWMRHGMHALAEVLPNAIPRTLEGQTHMVKPKILAPALVQFFAG